MLTGCASKKGDQAKITTDAYPNEFLNGELNVINEGADAVSGLYQAEVKVRPGNKKLASGLFARVEIVPSSKKKLQTVPIEAIVEGQGKNAFVFVVNDDKKSVRKLPIVVAYLEDKTAFISSGLDSVKEVIAAEFSIPHGKQFYKNRLTLNFFHLCASQNFQLRIGNSCSSSSC
ncbi:MAG: hypothetical protein QM734_12470 [Cyclobacteriaceae bacterium]